MFNQQLIRKINNGRCLLLVGSGPSCEVGYPSWREFAQQAYQGLVKLNKVSDVPSYEKYIRKEKYPELFRQMERDLDNDRTALIDILKPILTPRNGRGRLYELFGKWPFACYLTTNYDDEIEASLTNSKHGFKVIRNQEQDFYLWRDGVSNLIQKLHSDLDHPDELILTSADYRRLYVDNSGQYFRDGLKKVFSMFDVLVIGHSLTDPDIDFVLKLAKNTASPDQPIYFVGTGHTGADEKELLEKYNIVLVRYDNADGQHSELLRMLRTADRFISPRPTGRGVPVADGRPADEVEAAMALSLYRRLLRIPATDYLGPLILAGLDGDPSQPVALSDVAAMSVLSDLSTDWGDCDRAIDEATRELDRAGLVEINEGKVSITAEGSRNVRHVWAVRDWEKDQAYQHFDVAIRGICGDVTDGELADCRKLAEETIVGTFRNRGSIIANKVYSDQKADAGELSDVFAQASDRATSLERQDVRAAFMEGVYQFIVEPTAPQTDYLTSVSQGYFLYHLLGLDPRCGEVRASIFRKTLWIFDSSVVLPLVAVGCYNHQYSLDLFERLVAEDTLMCITSRLLEEAWGHFLWAVDFAEQNRTDSLEFLRAALHGGSYKQNLFLDGYIRLSADGTTGTFRDYLRTIVPSGKIEREAFEENLTCRGVRLVRIPEVAGFSQDDWGDIEEVSAEIQRVREGRGTYRSALQVKAEAEVLVLLRKLREGKYSIDGLLNADRFYFVSQSPIIDSVSQKEAVTTWSPEAVYRYLSALPKGQVKPDLLQQCMLHEYYYAGVSFIDSERYMRFFGPSINAAKASYGIEKAQYLTDIEDRFTQDADEAFDRTPELEKPFYVAQMGWRNARESKRREEAALRRAAEAEEKVRKLEAEKERAWKKRDTRSQEQEEARRRNLQDPKHVRKRQRQAKKREKQKKK